MASPSLGPCSATPATGPRGPPGSHVATQPRSHGCDVSMHGREGPVHMNPRDGALCAARRALRGAAAADRRSVLRPSSPGTRVCTGLAAGIPCGCQLWTQRSRRGRAANGTPESPCGPGVGVGEARLNGAEAGSRDSLRPPGYFCVPGKNGRLSPPGAEPRAAHDSFQPLRRLREQLLRGGRVCCLTGS